jgi:hypothetical protein
VIGNAYLSLRVLMRVPMSALLPFVAAVWSCMYTQHSASDYEEAAWVHCILRLETRGEDARCKGIPGLDIQHSTLHPLVMVHPLV